MCVEGPAPVRARNFSRREILQGLIGAFFITGTALAPFGGKAEEDDDEEQSSDTGFVETSSGLKFLDGMLTRESPPCNPSKDDLTGNYSFCGAIFTKNAFYRTFYAFG